MGKNPFKKIEDLSNSGANLEDISATWRELKISPEKTIWIHDCMFENSRVYIYKISDKGIKSLKKLLISKFNVLLGTQKTFIRPADFNNYETFFSELELLDIKTKLKNFLMKNYKQAIKKAKINEDFKIVTMKLDENVFEVIREIEKLFNEPIVYETIEGVNLKTWIPSSPEDIEELYDCAIFEGWSIDPVLKEISIAMLHYFPNYYKEIMKYIPHSIIVTGSKAGKTSIFSKLGMVADGVNVTFARLLGFSTSESVEEGALNHFTFPLAIDELEELKDREIGVALLSLMEMGETNILKGKRNLHTKFNNALVFLSNQILEDVEVSLPGASFKNLIHSIHTNLEALATRIGVVYFNPETKPAIKETKYTLEEIDRAKVVLGTLRRTITKEALKMLHNDEILDMLRNPPSEYEEELSKIINIQTALDDKLKKFFSKLHDNYRHMNGFAFFRALFDPETVFYYLKDEKDEFYRSIKEKFKLWQKWVRDINIKSVKRIVENLQEFKEAHLINTLEYNISRLPKAWQEFLDVLAFVYNKENEKLEEMLHIMSKLEKYSDTIKMLQREGLISESISSRFKSRLVNTARLSIKNLHYKLKSLGITLMEYNGEYYLKANWDEILPLIWKKRLAPLYDDNGTVWDSSDISGSTKTSSPDSDGTVGATGSNGTAVLEDTLYNNIYIQGAVPSAPAGLVVPKSIEKAEKITLIRKLICAYLYTHQLTKMEDICEAVWKAIQKANLALDKKMYESLFEKVFGKLHEKGRLFEPYTDGKYLLNESDFNDEDFKEFKKLAKIFWGGEDERGKS